MKRKRIGYKVKYAATLLQMRHQTPDGRWELNVPFSAAQHMTVEQIERLYEIHHYPIPHAQGGSDHPSNLVPMLVADHREVTAKKDIPQIAKTKRVTKAEEEFRQRLLTPRDQRPAKKSKWASRPFPKRRKP